MKIKIHPSWQTQLQDHFNTEEFKAIAEKARNEYLDKSKTIFPHPKNVFRAFNETPFDKIKVVILGQDPYHNPGQAHGLCFSVPTGMQPPPSLQNIFKEIKSDIYPNSDPSHNFSPDLTRWAKQGVFLLNSVLTVPKNTPAGHRHIGWEWFTDKVIETISLQKNNIAFLLWGSFARSKRKLINPEKHLILEAPHPSPLSAHRGFFGCKHFSKTNQYLTQHKTKPIIW